VYLNLRTSATSEDWRWSIWVQSWCSPWLSGLLGTLLGADSHSHRTPSNWLLLADGDSLLSQSVERQNRLHFLLIQGIECCSKQGIN